MKTKWFPIEERSLLEGYPLLISILSKVVTNEPPPGGFLRLEVGFRMSKFVDSIKTWHVILTTALVTITVVVSLKDRAVQRVEGWLLPRAEAAEIQMTLEELIWRELRDVRQQLRKQKIYRAQVASDPKINEQQKLPLLAEIDADIEDMQREEACLEAGQLKCD